MSLSDVPTAAEARLVSAQNQAKLVQTTLERDLVRVTRMINEEIERCKTSVQIPGLWCPDEVEKHLKEKGYRVERYTVVVDDEPSPYPGLFVSWN